MKWYVGHFIQGILVFIWHSEMGWDPDLISGCCNVIANVPEESFFFLRGGDYLEFGFQNKCLVCMENNKMTQWGKGDEVVVLPLSLLI